MPVSTWLVTPIYKPLRPFGRGTALLRDLLNMIINRLLTGMVLHVEKWLFSIASHVLVYQRMYLYSRSRKTPTYPLEDTGETPSSTCFCFGNPFIFHL